MQPEQLEYFQTIYLVSNSVQYHRNFICLHSWLTCFGCWFFGFVCVHARVCAWTVILRGFKTLTSYLVGFNGASIL